MRKELLIYLGAIILSILYLFVGNKIAMKNYKSYFDTQSTGLKAKVMEVIERTNEKILGVSEDEGNIIIEFRAKILSGERKGEEIIAKQYKYSIEPMPQKEVEKGDKILLMEDAYIEAQDEWIMGTYIRSDALMALGAVFAVCLIIFGGFKGINTLISLIFTCLSIFVVFIPAILSGLNIYLWSIITCFYIVVMTLTLVNGINVKSLSAGIGCIGGAVLASLITLFMNKFLHLTGLVDDQSIFLLLLNENNPIDLKAVVFSSILIGGIGGMLDVSVDISSALSEVARKMRKRSFKGIYQSGINIGQDTIGTMASTLVLAYIGGSLSIVLLLIAYNNSLLYTMNMEMIVVEVLQAIVGSFGMLLTVPLTSLISARLLTRDIDKERELY
ncbi:YibE/F family protein [Anaeropeptidivorans aminofermentans]|uniref:YibE/F family protein n=1 Tax=Anaeropeptidivorans aminofermentans TaxID=2934315 RepID=UPI0020246602|nr:YibE/F family protein [Anaeropeptidivorans aminofermentans]